MKASLFARIRGPSAATGDTPRRGPPIKAGAETARFRPKTPPFRRMPGHLRAEIALRARHPQAPQTGLALGPQPLGVPKGNIVPFVA